MKLLLRPKSIALCELYVLSSDGRGAFCQSVLLYSYEVVVSLPPKISWTEMGMGDLIITSHSKTNA